jgi:hypothetical protein
MSPVSAVADMARLRRDRLPICPGAAHATDQQQGGVGLRAWVPLRGKGLVLRTPRTGPAAVSSSSVPANPLVTAQTLSSARPTVTTDLVRVCPVRSRWPMAIFAPRQTIRSNVAPDCAQRRTEPPDFPTCVEIPSTRYRANVSCVRRRCRRHPDPQPSQSSGISYS